MLLTKGVIGNTVADLKTSINKWIQATSPRTVLTAPRTFYVRSDGLDTNDGFANTAGSAWATIQHAINVVAGSVDTGGHDVTIQVGDGTYVTANVLTSVVGGGHLVISGNATTPANVVVAPAAGDCFFADASAGHFVIQNLKMISATGNGVTVARATISISNVDFGTCGVAHIFAGYAGLVSVHANYAVSGGALIHWAAEHNGVISADGYTVTFSNAPNFSIVTAFATNGGVMTISSMTFTNGGTVTGTRYLAQVNGVIATAGGGANYIPGNVAGSTASGGQYS